MTIKIQYCFNCGEELGTYYSWSGDIESCGAKECEKEARYQHQCEDDDALYQAEQDDYNRYR